MRSRSLGRVAAAGVAAALAVNVGGWLGTVASAATPTASPAAPGSVPAPPSWSAPSVVDPAQGPPGSLSCLSKHFCMAVDGYGNYLTWFGRHWSAPRLVDPKGAALSSVSCASASFCVAVDLNDHAFAWDGRSWSAPVHVLPLRSAPRPSDYTVSCPSATFCMAGDGVAIWDGERWSAGLQAGVGYISATSCAAARFCAAIGEDVMATWDGRGWTKPAQVGTLPQKDGFRDGTLQTLACTSATFCMAGTNEGYFLFWDGSRWSSPVRAVFNSAQGALACASAEFCVATGNLGYQVVASTWDGTSWSPSPAPAPASVGPTSCPSPSFCAAFDNLGQVVTWDGKHWSTPALVEGAQGGVSGLACPAANSCLMVDQGGNALSWDGSRWSGPVRRTALGVGFGALSCPSPRSCMALERSDQTAGVDQATWWDGRRWSAALPVDPRYFPSDISCASNNFCVVVDDGGHVVVWDGRGWSQPVEVDPPPPYRGGPPLVGSFAYSISCSTARSCAVVDDWGRALTWDGKRWSQRVLLGTGDSLDDVSCASAKFCIALATSGATFSWDGAKWSQQAVLPVATGARSVISCVTAAFCGVVAGNEATTWERGRWSAPEDLGETFSAVAISCPAVGLCIAAGGDGRVVVGRVVRALPASNAVPAPRRTKGATVLPAECEAAQLRVVFFGENGAAGTGNTSIGIANVSKRACWLEGAPTVRATVEAVSRKKPAPAMQIEHSGPAFLFPAKAPRVLLSRAQPTPLGVGGFRYPSISAGFVILNADWGGPGLCPEVTYVSVKLPGLAARFPRVRTAIFACGDFISVSPVLGRVPVIGAVYEGTGTI